MSVVNACGELTEAAVGTLSGTASFEACNPGVISIGANGLPTSTSDVQYMVQREVCGDGELIVRVLSVSGGKAGLELRTDNAPGAVKAGLKTNLSNFVDRIVRTQPNAAQSSQQMSAPGQPWLKIVRNGNSVVTYTSANGSNWNQAAAYTLSLPTCIQAGVLMQSVNNATTHTGTFSNLTFSGFSLPSGPTTTLSFAADTLHAAAGDTVQVCVNIADACACSPASVQVALQGSGSPHLTTYSTQTLQFQNGDTQKCFSLPIAAAPGNGTYALSLQNAAGGNGASAGEVGSLTLKVVGETPSLSSFCGISPPMFNDSSLNLTIEDRFGNFYPLKYIEIPDLHSSFSTNQQAFSSCDCSMPNIPTGYFRLFFEDCIFTNSGFNDPILGAERRRVVCTVFSELSQLINLQNSNACTSFPQIVNIRIQPSEAVPGITPASLPSNVGGVASAYYSIFMGFDTGLPWRIINTGSIPDASFTREVFHGFMRINFNQNAEHIWSTDIQNPPGAPGLTDLYTVIWHEALHILGFASRISTRNSFFLFDQYVRASYPADPSTFHPVISQVPVPPFLGYAPVFNATEDFYKGCQDIDGVPGPDLFFQGQHGFYPILSNNTNFILQEQSHSHLNPNCDGALTPGYLMSFGLPPGIRRPITDDELDILCTLGYEIIGIPACNSCILAGIDDYGPNCNSRYEVPLCESITIRIQDLMSNDHPDVSEISELRLVSDIYGSLTFDEQTASYNFTPSRLGLATLSYFPMGCEGRIGPLTHVYIRILPSPECSQVCENAPEFSCSDVSNFPHCSVSTAECRYETCNLICNPNFCNGIIFGALNSPIGLIDATGFSANLNYAIVPEWYRSHGTPDLTFFSVNSPPRIRLGSDLTNLSEGVWTMLNDEIQAGNYLIGIQLDDLGVRDGSVLIVADLVAANNIEIPSHINDAPLATGTGIQLLAFSSETNLANKLLATCMTINPTIEDALHLHLIAGSGLGEAIFSYVEFLPDNFSAGADQTIVCGEEALLGGAHCMLTDVGIQYQWFELDENGIPSTNPIASYRVRNNSMTDVQGAIDMTTRELLVSPLSTTSYLLRREIFDFGGLPATFELCEMEDIVAVVVEENLPSAAFTYTETDCIADFSSLDPTPGLQHLWVFGNTGQTSTAQHPSGIALPEGVHLVTHTVTGPCGTDEQTLTLTIQNCCTAPQPTATFEAGALDDCGLFGFRILTQGSGALTFTWNVDGQTYTGLEAEHTFTASGDYLLTLTVTNACGQSVVYTQTIEVKLPTADAAFSPFVYCLDAAFTPAHTDGTHLWDFGDGATSSAATAQHTYAAPGAYTVTHTYTEPLCGAQAVQTLSITVSECDLNNFSCPCTEPNSINIDAGNGELLLSNLIAAGIMPAGGVNSRCIAIRGSLRVDADYALVFCEVRMQPAAGIVVESFHTLGLSSVSRNGGIYGCGEMWRGIRVETEARLNSRSSWIADAQYAVEAMDKSNVLLQSNTLRRNYTGLFFNAGGEFNLENFADNTLDGADPLLPPFAGQMPAPGTRPFAGVDVSSQSNLHIGVAGAQPNRFLHLRNGIITNNTNTEIRNSTFEGILRTNTEPNYAFTGHAVRHSGGAAHALTLEGLGKNAAATFHNCTEGVWATGTDVDVQEARMTAMSVGVTAQQGAERTLEVRNNNISATARGIQVLQSPQAARISIRDNEVTAGLAPPLQSRATAIRADGSSAIPGAEIRNNEVATLGSDLGILVNACAGFEVDNNEVEVLSADNAQGILMAGGTDNILSNNTVTGLLGTGNGVWLNGAGNIRLWCNTLSTLNMGLQLSGHHTGADIATTLFRTPMGTGLHYNNGVLAPQQNGRGNRWEGTAQGYSVAAARHEGGSVFGVQSTAFFVLETFNPGSDFQFLPPSISVPNATPEDWFQPGDIASAICLTQPELQGNEEEQIKLERLIAADSIGALPEGTRWDANWALYRKLLAEPQLMAEDVVLTAFFNRMAQLPIGQLAVIEQSKEELYAPNATTEIVSEMARNLRYISVDIRKIDSLVFADTFEELPVHWYVLMEEAKLLSDSITALSAIADSLRRIHAVTLLADNASVTPGSLPEENLHTINTLYLESIASGSFAFSQGRQDTIASIAAQCPEEGGMAVFLARALQALVAPYILHIDTIPCVTQVQALSGKPSDAVLEESRVKVQETTEGGLSAKLFPNPAGSHFLLTYDAAQPTQMSIFDMFGKLRFSMLLAPGAGMAHTVDTLTLDSGVYLVSLRQATGETVVIRLLIVK